MREDEKIAEENRLRIVNHVANCQAFAQDLLDILLVQTPQDAENIQKAILNLLYGNNGKTK